MAIPRIYRAQDAAIALKSKGYERTLIIAYKATLIDVQNSIAQAYTKLPKVGEANYFAEMAKYSRLANLESEITGEIAKLTGQTTRTITRAVEKQYGESYLRTGFILERETGAKLAFGILDKPAIQRAVENPLDTVGFINRVKENQAVMVRQVREQLTRGLISGDSYQQMAKRITDRFDVGANKALTVVRTETHRVVQKGRLDAFEQAASRGVILKRQWVSATDSRTREDHGAADGQAVLMEEPFIVGGERLMYPGDPAGSPENVINCRCATIGVIEGYEPNFTSVRHEHPANYEEWLKQK